MKHTTRPKMAGEKTPLWLIVLSIAFAGMSASGETWILNKTHSDAWWNMEYWTSADAQTNGLSSSALVAGDDYLVKSGYRLTLKKRDGFTGNSLTIGDESGAGTLRLEDNRVVFGNAGLFLRNGQLWNTKHGSDVNKLDTSSNLIGRVTVTAPKTSPFTYYSAYHNFYLLMDGELLGDDSAALQIGGEASSHSNCLLTVNHAAGFEGDIIVKSARTPGNGRDFGYGLGLGNSTYPGCISFKSADTLLMAPAVGSVASVSALEIAEGTRLRYDLDSTLGGAGLIDVYNTLTLPEGGVAVEAEYEPKASTTGEEIRCAILRAPPSMRLDAGAFSFSPNPKYALSSGKLPQRVHFEVDTDPATDRDTLYAVIEPIVTLKSGKYYANWQEYAASANVGSPFNAGSVCWSDNKPPHEKAHYLINTDVNLPLEHDKDWDFPGYSLMAGNENDFIAMFGKNKKFSVPLLESGSITLAVGQQATPSVFGGGKIRLHDGCQLKLQVFKSNSITVESEMEGNFDILLSGIKGYIKSFYLTAPNTNFLGRIVFGDIGSSAIENYQNLVVADARNLGGRLPEFRYDALALSEFGRVHVDSDITLASDANRGISVMGDGGAFSVKEGAVLECHWPIAIGAPLWKFQEGTLALGGEVRFVETANGVTNLVDAIPEDGVDRRLIVTNGFLKALAPDCVNGLTVELAQMQKRDIALVLDFAAGNEELARYGFRNVKTGTPFVGEKINVSVENADEASLGRLRRDKLGLVTVRTSVADDLSARLNVKRPDGRICSIVREDDPATGWSTFSMKVRFGFVVNVR